MAAGLSRPVILTSFSVRTLSPVPADTLVDRSMDLLRIGFRPQHAPPSALRVLLASVVALIGSLAADAVLVAIAKALAPSLKAYPHLVFSDYGELTVIGVIVACLGWPIVTRISSAPRWLFFRLAMVVTLVLFLPDLYILKQGQPAKAVVVLMCMHVAIAWVTYNALVHLAPVGSARERSGPQAGASGG
jgi:hypothetical protein